MRLASAYIHNDIMISYLHICVKLLSCYRFMIDFHDFLELLSIFLCSDSKPKIGNIERYSLVICKPDSSTTKNYIKIELFGGESNENIYLFSKGSK